MKPNTGKQCDALKVNFVAFEVRGNSMNDGTLRSICEKDILQAKELEKGCWPKLEIPRVLVIVHKTEGITVREVRKLDLETGRILCHSWNDGPEFTDFELNLEDIAQIYIIKSINRSVKF